MPILETLGLILTSSTAASVAKFLYEKVDEYIHAKLGNKPSKEVERLRREIEELKNKLEAKDLEEVTPNEVEELKEKVRQIEQSKSPLPPQTVSGEVFQKWSEKGDLDVEDQALITMRQLEVLIDKAGELGIKDQKRFKIQQMAAIVAQNVKNLREARFTAAATDLPADKAEVTRFGTLLQRNIFQARDLLKGY